METETTPVRKKIARAAHDHKKKDRVEWACYNRPLLAQQPHAPDVKALLRAALLWNIPIACIRASAKYRISSPLMGDSYERYRPDYGQHLAREIPDPPDREGKDPR